MICLLGLLLVAAPVSADPGFDEKYERDYNIFNSINQYRPDNPLNPINSVDPNNPFNPINRVDPGNPANPLNRINPNNPLNPINECDKAGGSLFLNLAPRRSCLLDPSACCWH